MALTFYAGSGSPYAWRVWLTLEHKQLPYELRMLSFAAGDLKKPEFLAINPRGKVPAVVDDGFVLTESAAIVEYLDARFPDRPVFPRDLRGGSSVRRMVREVDEYVQVPMEQLVDQILFTKEDLRDPVTVSAARAKLVVEIGTGSAWDRALVDGAWLAGPVVTAADFTLYPMVALIQRIESKNPSVALMNDVAPRVRAWMKRVEELPHFAKTYPPHWK